jgi:hypothetical protein
MDRFMDLIDPMVVQEQIICVLNEDAESADVQLDRDEREFLKALAMPAFDKNVQASAEKYTQLLLSQRRARMLIDESGAARATWLTVQVEPDREVVLHVGVG